MMTDIMIRGIGNAAGFAIGKVRILKDTKLAVKKHSITDREAEIDLLDDAVSAVKEDLHELEKEAKLNIGTEKAEIFETHEALLEDPAYIEKVKERIRTEGLNAEYILKEETERLSAELLEIPGDIFKERVNDLKDVSVRLTYKLLDIENPDLITYTGNTVLIAHDLVPSQTLRMDFSKVAGIVTEVGGITSHSSIITKARGIPAIVGAKDMIKAVSDGDTVIVDSLKGQVFISPGRKQIDEYSDKILEMKRFQEITAHEPKGPAATDDNHPITVEANIGKPSEADTAVAYGADGVGLFRSEFLYLERDSLPPEDVQFLAYKQVLQKFSGKTVVIRTMDIGGDKILPYLHLTPEHNPFLGLRAIRLSLRYPDLFHTQLKALVRASAFGDLRIMLPMISSVKELRYAEELLEKVKTELEEEKKDFNRSVQMGVMIETPAAVLLSDALAVTSSFFSIGTNDLTQYTTAVDRMNNEIADLYSPYHPAVIRSIKIVIDNAHMKNISVAVCGETAGDLSFIPLLIGLGVDTLSVSPSLIPSVKWLIRRSSMKECKIIADKTLAMTETEEIRYFLTEKFKENKKSIRTDRNL